jgi:uncharacterized tellurite resistance protein B-like protein
MTDGDDDTGFGFGDEPLADAITAQMRGADPANVARVIAITGLLARIAFSDRKFQKEERELIARQLAALHGVSEADRKVVIAALMINVDTVSEDAAKRYATVLRDLEDKDLCLQVLRMLVDIAGADGSVADGELWNLRGIANDMGLAVEDFDRTLERLKT